MSEDLFKQYKRLADDRLSESNAEMWDRIEETLELDKGWDRIDASLRRRKRRPVILMCLITGLLMLISVFGYFKFDSTPSPSSSIFNADKTALGQTEGLTRFDTEKKLNTDKIAITNAAAGTGNNPDNFRMGEIHRSERNQHETVLNYDKAKNSANSNDNFDLNNTGDSTAGLKLRRTLESSGVISMKESYIYLPMVSADNLAHLNAQDVLLANGFLHNAKSRLYILAASGVRGTLFLNNHTSKAIRNESFEYVNIKPNSSFQFGFGAELHGRWILETRVHLNNQGGQSAHYISEGKSVFADTRLKYTSLEISAGKFINHGNSPRMRWFCSSWQAGAYISFLQDVSVYTNSSRELNNSEFKSSDYGLVLRYNLHKRIGSFDITAGAVTSFGLRNISKTQTAVPSYFNRCYNVAAGLNAGCKYFF
jgi:hypothetical protein